MFFIALILYTLLAGFFLKNIKGQEAQALFMAFAIIALVIMIAITSSHSTRCDANGDCLSRTAEGV